MTTPTVEALDEYLAIPFGDELPETTPTIEGEVEASATLRRLRLIRDKITANMKVADAETTKINQWERSVNAPLEAQAKFFEAVLEGYMRHVRDSSEGKTKSITLPGGKIGTTAQQPKWAIEDVEAYGKWLRENKLVELYKIKVEPLGLPVIKKKFVDDGDGNVINPDGGELVPGLKITPPEQPYTIKITTTDN